MEKHGSRGNPEGNPKGNQNGNPNGNPKLNPKAVHNTPTVQALSKPATADTDPMGSYTGVPLDPNEQPIQDADDL